MFPFVICLQITLGNNKHFCRKLSYSIFAFNLVSMRLQLICQLGSSVKNAGEYVSGCLNSIICYLHIMSS